VPKLQLPTTPIITGSSPSGSCKHGQHLKCTGRAGPKYGMPGIICTCSCHKIKKEVIK
jgi:hypothetical protein